MPQVRIGILADHRPDHETHIATDAALAHAAGAGDVALVAEWVGTDTLAGDVAGRLTGFHGLLVAPGSPYRSMQGALDAITYARTTSVPILGTCGGFQHMVIEYARNVVGAADAGHAEYDPDAADPMIAELACSLAGQTMDVTIRHGTTAWDAYATDRTMERYYCSFGINPTRRSGLEDGGLTVSGTDQDGEIRIIEVDSDTFYLATLFVPQAHSTATAPHPVIVAFLHAAARHASSRP